MSDALRDRIESALLEYRCQHSFIDEEGNPMPLVDALTPHGASSIKLGKDEIHLIADVLAQVLVTNGEHPAQSVNPPSAPAEKETASE